MGVCFAVQNDGDHGASHTGGEHAGIAFRLQNKTRDDAHDESDADGNREGGGQSGHVDAGHQEKVR